MELMTGDLLAVPFSYRSEKAVLNVPGVQKKVFPFARTIGDNF